MASVGPKQAEALRRAHAALEKDLSNLEEAARGPSGVLPAEMHLRLTRTRAHLAEHFHFEEQNGYMDAVLSRAPNRQRLVERLHEEHAQLANDLNALIDAAAKAHGPDEGLRGKALAWLARVRAHETREDTLVQDAFNVDVSAED